MPSRVSFALVLLLIAAGLSAQEKPAASGAMKVCSAKNPPPCADTAPRLTHHVEPSYNDEARRMKLNGTVLLHFIVGTDGRPHDVTVIRPLGHGLDEQAVKAVRKWRFTPGARAGEPVPVELEAEASFRIY